MRLALPRHAGRAGQQGLLPTMRRAALPAHPRQPRPHARVLARGRRADDRGQRVPDRRARGAGQPHLDDAGRLGAHALRRRHDERGGARVRDDDPHAGARYRGDALHAAAAQAGMGPEWTAGHVPSGPDGTAMGHGRGLHARNAGVAREARASRARRAGGRAVVIRNAHGPGRGRGGVLRRTRALGAGAGDRARPATLRRHGHERGGSNMTAMTAAEAGLMVCHTCSLLSRPSAGHEAACARCGASLHLRKPDSVTRAWAFLIAAYILYVPANVLPVMKTGSPVGGPAAIAFGAVVVMTMFAAESFDPRLMWDPVRRHDG